MIRNRPARTGAPEPFAAAMSALAACGDAAATAGHSLASTYLAGAAGNLRHAMACLGAATGADDGFDMHRVGASELIGAEGVVDTIRNCRLPDGGSATVHALIPAARPELGVWLRSDPALRHLGVRGTVRIEAGGATFHDGGAPAGSGSSGPDLARDLLRTTRLELSDNTEAAAWELSLAAGSWVHLVTGRRWYADRPTARAVVRALGGLPTLTDAQARRIGAVVDRDVLVAIEALGWRQWPMPSID